MRTNRINNSNKILHSFSLRLIFGFMSYYDDLTVILFIAAFRAGSYYGVYISSFESRWPISLSFL